MSRPPVPFLCALVALGASLPAQEPLLDVPSAPRPALSAMHIPRETDRVWFDRAEDGTVWVRGADYKASFHASGATYIPFFGSSAPRNFPIEFALERIEAGGRSQAILADGAVTRAERVVEIDRGVAVERYELRPESIEQLFVFPKSLGPGDLTVRMKVTTELSVSPDADGGFRFEGEWGAVRYGAAVAFDARGRRTPVASCWHAGGIEHRVPAEFVERAAFPLTIDPVILIFGVVPQASSGLPQRNADVAFLGGSSPTYLVVYEEIYSATDHDVYARLVSPAGIPSIGEYVDYTSTPWTRPRVASHRRASQFLVVAERTASPGADSVVWGRSITYAGAFGLLMGTQFPVHGFGNGKNPDVGGDPNPGIGIPPGHYCVVWEGVRNGEIYYNIVRTDESLMWPNGVLLDFDHRFASRPSISKSCGVGPPSAQEWVLVHQRTYGLGDEDIHGTIVAVDGTITAFTFRIDFGITSDSNPVVSSRTDSDASGTRRWMVAYERTIPSPFGAHTDLIGQVFNGTTSLTGPVNLSTLVGATGLAHQDSACLDTDGCRFVLGYTERPPIIFQNQDVAPYLTAVHVLGGNQLAVTEGPQLVNGYVGPDERMQITSERSGGGTSNQFLAAWDTTSVTSPDSNITAALYRAHVDASPSTYFQRLFPGCGRLVLDASGLPALNTAITLSLAGVAGVPYLAFGVPMAPVSLCPGCQLGLDPATTLAFQASTLTITIPCSTALIGQSLGVQGFDVGAAGGCPGIVLSGVIRVTFL